MVDDASTDETPRALARVEGITLLTNPAPRGLVAARNQGAAAARGRYLAFIGNGARPSPPGWRRSSRWWAGIPRWRPPRPSSSIRPAGACRPTPP